MRYPNEEWLGTSPDFPTDFDVPTLREVQRTRDRLTDTLRALERLAPAMITAPTARARDVVTEVLLQAASRIQLARLEPARITRRWRI